MVTIREVAQRAGVSVKTVSRVVNDIPYVSASTRVRVEKAIRELGYVPNAPARTLALQKTFTLGLVIPDISSAALSLLVEGVEAICRESGYNLMLCTTGGDRDREEESTRQLVRRQRIDGFILLSDRLNVDFFFQLYQEGLPYVAVGRELPTDDIPQVYVDNRAGMAAAATHLVRLGHQNIGYISCPIVTSTSVERLEGFEAALRQHGLDYADRIYMDGKNHVAIGRAGMNLLLSRDTRPSAVCTFNDLIALGALQVLKERQLRVPDDVALVGFDDIQAAAFVEPALTTVHQPLYEMGATATKLLMKLLRGEELTQRKVTLPVHLIIRQSCGGTRQAMATH